MLKPRSHVVTMPPSPPPPRCPRGPRAGITLQLDSRWKHRHGGQLAKIRRTPILNKSLGWLKKKSLSFLTTKSPIKWQHLVAWRRWFGVVDWQSRWFFLGEKSATWVGLWDPLAFCRRRRNISSRPDVLVSLGIIRRCNKASKRDKKGISSELNSFWVSLDRFSGCLFTAHASNEVDLSKDEKTLIAQRSYKTRI